MRGRPAKFQSALTFFCFLDPQECQALFGNSLGNRVRWRWSCCGILPFWLLLGQFRFSGSLFGRPGGIYVLQTRCRQLGCCFGKPGGRRRAGGVIGPWRSAAGAGGTRVISGPPLSSGYCHDLINCWGFFLFFLANVRENLLVLNFHIIA